MSDNFHGNAPSVPKFSIVTLLLFRDETIAWARRLPEILTGVGASGESGRQETEERFQELIGEGRRWPEHPHLWCLHGRPKREHSLALIELASESYTYAGRALIVERLAKTYSWCLVPWGGDFTSQMLAFISTEDKIIDQALNSLKENGCNDMLVSTYATQDLEQRQFKGAIFARKPESRAQNLWTHGIGSSGSVLVLRSDPDTTPLAMPDKASTILEMRTTMFGSPIRQAWVRVEDESGFLHYAMDPFTAIITAPDLNERHMEHALESFERVRRDPLHFGIKALESASWIYIPGTEREKLEVYVNNDPSVTTALLQNKGLTSSSFFAHRSFC